MDARARVSGALAASRRRLSGALRLARYFGTDPRFWINLQAAHDLSEAEAAHDYSGITPRRVA